MAARRSPYSRPFLEATLRALDRLNPKLLSSGGTVNITEAGVTCCAIGAYEVHLGSRGSIDRIPADYDALMRFRIRGNSLSLRLDYSGRTETNWLIDLNEDFRDSVNDEKTQQLRYAHVRRHVERELARCAPALHVDNATGFPTGPTLVRVGGRDFVARVRGPRAT